MITPQLFTELTAVVRIVLLTVAFVFAVVAARGYSDAPWGAVLRPLPVAILALATSVATLLVDVSETTAQVVTVAVWTVGVGAVALSTYRFVDLVAERGDR
ncbi:hypothetical protein [Halospeciosus flavus]|uniref:PH regulation protein F n=1 Tax=Halospeciosus flavus TaxID=3032283 RepID=A0ABD5Z2N6_9EURY|nr:hypothetical protein [Halospeciosus flavus]